MLSRSKKSIVGISAATIAVVALYIFLLGWSFKNQKMILGVSFDPVFARYLGLSAGETYFKVLDDWKFKYIRLAAHWNQVETAPGVFNFDDLDWYVSEAGKRGAKITLAIGQKTPRWPECHIPVWASKLSAKEFTAARLKYIAAVVTHYRSNQFLEMWQVENEPFLPFGECPAFSTDELRQELNLVKQLDANHPRMVTDSGELSTWRRTATVAEYFGTTMYRVVWNKYLGYTSYDWLPAAFYRLKLWLVGRSVNTAFVSELQAEPWIPGQHIVDVALSEQAKSMDLTRLKKNIDYARKIGLPRAYLWGAEWWEWMGKTGHSEITDYIKNVSKVE